MTKLNTIQPMRVQVRKGSPAEARYYKSSGLPGVQFPLPKAIAPGVSPAPLEDLLFHGGKLVPQMLFQNIFLGRAEAWSEADVLSIDGAIALAMGDARLNNVLQQYFHRSQLSCDPLPLVQHDDGSSRPLGEPEVQAAVVALFDAGTLSIADLDRTIFNLVLPRGRVLTLGGSTSTDGLGGYHGSVHVGRGGRTVTLYYSASVYSEGENGIVAFDRPWKNVAATLYHELNEFRTDADVNDAIAQNANDFLGWTSRRGRECGDEPIAVAGSLDLVFQEVLAAHGARQVPVQFLYSNAVHGPEGPIDAPLAASS